MAAKKKKTKRPTKKTAKRAAKKRRAPAPRKAVRKKAARKPARAAGRGKHGSLKITVTRTGTGGYVGRVQSPMGGGAMLGASGNTPAEAMRATRALLAGRRGGSAGAGNAREALVARRIRAFCG